MTVHGSLTIDEKRNLVVIDIDQPVTAKTVTVKLTELDQGIDGEQTPDDLLATWKVELTNGAITVSETQLPDDPKKVRDGAIDVTFRGTLETFRIPILHDLVNDTAEDEVELELEVEVPGQGAYSTKSDPKLKSPPVKKKSGPVVCFMLKHPRSGDAFFKFAHTFWRDHADEIITPSTVNGTLSLERIREHLDQPLSGDFPSGPYEEVNIVTHGTIGGIQLNLFKSQENNRPTMQRANTIKDFTASTGGGALTRVDDTVDPNQGDVRRKGMSRTVVVIRGCNIGRDQCLVQALSDALGKAVVLAPKFIIGYRGVSKITPATPEFISKQYFLDSFSVYRPGHLASIPVTEVVSELEKTFGGPTKKTPLPDTSWPADAAGKGRPPFQVILETTQKFWTHDRYMSWFIHLAHEEFDWSFTFTANDQTDFQAKGISGAERAKRRKELIAQVIKETKKHFKEVREGKVTSSSSKDEKLEKYDMDTFIHHEDEWEYHQNPFIRHEGDKVYLLAWLPNPPKGSKILPRPPLRRTRIDARRIVVKAGKTIAAADKPDVVEKKLLEIALSDPAQFARSHPKKPCVLD